MKPKVFYAKNIQRELFEFQREKKVFFVKIYGSDSTKYIKLFLFKLIFFLS